MSDPYRTVLVAEYVLARAAGIADVSVVLERILKATTGIPDCVEFNRVLRHLRAAAAVVEGLRLEPTLPPAFAEFIEEELDLAALDAPALWQEGDAGLYWHARRDVWLPCVVEVSPLQGVPGIVKVRYPSGATRRCSVSVGCLKPIE